LILVVCVAAVASHDEALLEEFNQFMQKYNKVYTSDEFSTRFENYKATIERIAILNAQGGATFGINKFSDMTPEEFKSKVLMPTTSVTFADEPITPFTLNRALPTSVDWRDKGVVTPVKDQGQCGSCWAFSASEAIESAWILKGHATQSSINLSPQQIVDCDTQGAAGCNGGTTESAYNYILGAGGQEGIANYPYTAKNGACKFDAAKVVSKISAYTETGGDENKLQTNLVNLGPLSICVDAAHWQNYVSGVMTPSQCCPFIMCQLDHCVQLVGYNATTSPGYWIVRNSWNTDWGINGYIHLQMGSNVCGISKDSTWPTVQ